VAGNSEWQLLRSGQSWGRIPSYRKDQEEVRCPPIGERSQQKNGGVGKNPHSNSERIKRARTRKRKRGQQEL